MQDRNNPAIVEMVEIHKRFGGRTALENARLSLHHGEILGLVGDNGAGKSTLMKILSGAIPMDSGYITVAGSSYNRMTPRLSRSLGIEMVYQDLSLCETMTVWENVFLGRYSRLKIAGRRFPLLNKQIMKRETAGFLGKLGLDIRNIDRPVRRLSGGQRQAVAICRALMFQPKIILLDEPTASMAMKEQERILGLISDFRKSGISIIIISHDISQLLTVVDRVLVLKSGGTIWSGNASETEPAMLLEKMFVSG